MSEIPISVRRLPNGNGLPLPAYATEHAAGLDLYAALEEDLQLDPGQRALVPTGLIIALPQGFEAQIRPRSGLAIQHGLTVLNSPGTIDADYRGEVCVILVNLGEEAFTITRGTRIAQMILAPVSRARLCETTSLPESHRGEGGFGSTGRGAGPNFSHSDGT